jgi:phage host-nuclease inhibitor protein Gam
MSAQPEDLIWSDSEADVDLEAWSPLDLTVPERLMRQLRHVHERAVWISEQADAMRAPINQWEAEKLVPLGERAAELERQLTELARRFREADEKHNKTLSLPSGKVTSKAVPPKVVVADEGQVIAFLHAYAAEFGRPPEDFLRVKVEVKKKELDSILVPDGLKKGLAVVLDGAEVPGVEVVPGDVSFKVVIE